MTACTACNNPADPVGGVLCAACAAGLIAGAASEGAQFVRARDVAERYRSEFGGNPAAALADLRSPSEAMLALTPPPGRHPLGLTYHSREHRGPCRGWWENSTATCHWTAHWAWVSIGCGYESADELAWIEAVALAHYLLQHGEHSHRRGREACFGIWNPRCEEEHAEADAFAQAFLGITVAR